MYMPSDAMMYPLEKTVKLYVEEFPALTVCFYFIMARQIHLMAGK